MVHLSDVLIETRRGYRSRRPGFLRRWGPPIGVLAVVVSGGVTLVALTALAHWIVRGVP